MAVSNRIQEAKRMGAAIRSRRGTTSGCVSFQCGKTNLACRELALKPVPVTMFLLAHPSCRVCYIRDVQGLLQHTELVLCRLPVTQTIFSSMDKIVVVPCQVLQWQRSAAKTLFGIAMAPRRAVV